VKKLSKVMIGLCIMLVLGTVFASASNEIDFGRGEWFVEDGVVKQLSNLDNCRAFFGDPSWTDYTFEVEAKKLGGDEGFLLMFAALDNVNFYWANIGGWVNTQSVIEHEAGGSRYVYNDYLPDWVDTNQWYKFKIVVTPDNVKVYRDGELMFDETIMGYGMVGLGTWITQSEYRNISVKANDGSWEYTPDL